MNYKNIKNLLKKNWLYNKLVHTINIKVSTAKKTAIIENMKKEPCFLKIHYSKQLHNGKRFLKQKIIGVQFPENAEG